MYFVKITDDDGKRYRINPYHIVCILEMENNMCCVFTTGGAKFILPLTANEIENRILETKKDVE